MVVKMLGCVKVFGKDNRATSVMGTPESINPPDPSPMMISPPVGGFGVEYNRITQAVPFH
jgi:hypothetical protein